MKGKWKRENVSFKSFGPINNKDQNKDTKILVFVEISNFMINLFIKHGK